MVENITIELLLEKYLISLIQRPSSNRGIIHSTWYPFLIPFGCTTFRKTIIALFYEQMTEKKFFHECFHTMNSLPNNKHFDWSKLKVFADNNINVNGKLKFGLKRVENIVGRRENAGYYHFLLCPQCFQKPSASGSIKVGIVWYRVKNN